MQRRREEGDVAERRAVPQMEEEEEVMMMMMRERASSAGTRRKPPADFGNGGGGVNFSTNKNSVVCLPLVSEGLKLVWTQSDQTRELDSIPSLVRAFNLFPYPSAAEIGALARDAGLPLDKVKVWFMVQRIKYGITWSSEEIEETRLKLRAGVGGGGAEDEYEVEEEEEDEEEFAYASGENGEGVPQFEVGGGDVEDREDDNGDDNGAGSAPLEETGASPFLEQPPKYRDPRRDQAPAFAYFPAAAPPAAHDPDPDPDPYRRHPPPPEGPAAPRLPPRPHGRYKKTKAQLAALRHSFARHNFPNEAELRRLQEETGLTRIEIRKWFSDSRYQLRINGRGGGLYRGRGARGGTDASFFESFLSRSLEASGFSAQAAMAADAGGRDGGAMEEEEEEEEEGGGGGGMAGRGVASDMMGEQYEEEEEVGVEVEAVAAVVEEEEEEEEEGEGQQLLFINGKGELETQIACGSPSALVSPAPSPSLYPPKRTSSPAPQPARPGAPPSSSSSSSPPPPPLLTPSGRPRKTKAQLDVLKQFFLRCQWPRSEDYSQLVQLTGLPRPDVIQWFGDTRYAVKNGQLRWVKGVSLDLASEILHQQGGGGRRRRHSPGLNGGEGAARLRPGGGGGDLRPLEQYLQGTGGLQERDLDALCRRARMSYQQVRDWFACREQGVAEVEVNLSDGEGPADGRK